MQSTQSQLNPTATGVIRYKLLAEQLSDRTFLQSESQCEVHTGPTDCCCSGQTWLPATRKHSSTQTSLTKTSGTKKPKQQLKKFCVITEYVESVLLERGMKTLNTCRLTVLNALDPVSIVMTSNICYRCKVSLSLQDVRLTPHQNSLTTTISH